MTAVQPNYAAELVLTTGKVQVFDDPGCLAAFVREGSVETNRIHSLWVADYLDPAGAMLTVEDAVFLRSPALRTPMNHGVAALRPGPAADSLRTALGGTLVAWNDVLAGDRP